MMHAKISHSDDLTDRELEWLGQRVVYFGMRIVRACVVSGVAAWLSSAQNHVDYSEWAIALLVFVFAALNRFYSVAGLVVGWLVVLYLLPPDLMAAVKAMRG